MLPSYTIPVTRLFSVTFLYEKNTPLWSQQIPSLNDYEASREARMLQAPIKGRKKRETGEPLSRG